MASLAMATTTTTTTLAAKFHCSSRSVKSGASSKLRASRTTGISYKSIGVSCYSSANPSTTSLELETSSSPRSVKEFLEDLKSVGRVRIIVNTGVGVLESVVNGLDGLFYKEFPGKGEYANLMIKEDNVDFHLLVDKVVSAKLIQGTSMQGNIATYMVRFFDSSETNVASIMVMWGDNGGKDYDHGQVESFKDLVTKYGSDIKFSFK